MSLSLSAPRSSTCPNEVAIDAFVSGAVDEAGRRAMLAHLAGCHACCRLVGALMTSGGSASSRASASGGEGPSLGHYRVGEPVGFGGMGMVYSAYDPRLDRKVALKVLWSDGSAEVLHREARAMAKLAHPNVVPVFDVGVDRGRVYVAMELVDGGTMRTWLAAGPRPWPEVLARFRQAGQGIGAAHAEGLVHRDIKPENLLLRRDGTVLVSDFGLARAAPSEIVSRAMGDATTTTGAGTPAYMAPEQLRGEPIDARADVYAFSVAMWEALYGARPFVFGRDDELLASIARGPRVPPARPGAPPVPAHIGAALARGMAFQRNHRFLSIAELLAACEGPANSPFASYGPPQGRGSLAPLAPLAEPPPPAHGYGPSTAPMRASHGGPSAPPALSPSAVPTPNGPPPAPYASPTTPYGAAPTPHGSAPGPYGQSLTPPSAPPLAHGSHSAIASSGAVPSTSPSNTGGASALVWFALGTTTLVALAAVVALVLVWRARVDAPSAAEGPRTSPSAAAIDPAPPRPSATTSAQSLAVAPSPKPTAGPKPAGPNVGPQPTAPTAPPAPSVPKPAPSGLVTNDAGAPAVPVGGFPRKLRGMDFTPYGFEADPATDKLRENEPSLVSCRAETRECVQVTCDFDVAASGAVTSSRCRAWGVPGGCPASEACLNQKIRMIRFPPPPKAGTCQASFR